jgi:hypothetical protein
MPKQLLNMPYVCSTLKQMGGEAVPQHMRGNILFYAFAVGSSEGCQ